MVYQNRNLLESYDWKIRWHFVLIAFGIDGVALLLGSIIWSMIMRSLGVSIGFTVNLRHFCINMLARRIPGTIWYVAYRSQFYARYKIPITIPAIASGIEAIVSVVSAILVAFMFGIGAISEFISAPWIFIPISLIGLIVLHPRIISWIFMKFGKEIVEFQYKDVLVWLMLYVLLWGLSGTIIFFIANSVLSISVSYLTMIIGGWALIGALSYILLFLPSNLGFNEVGISLLFSSVIPSSFAVIIALFIRVGFIFFEMLWAACVIIISQLIQPIIEK
ncbi:MAG: hypothetical protein JW987_06035 [Anaerolineaceae bacterium]|nr:hypothetical protein [Anaerolineaceae bacterium]